MTPADGKVGGSIFAAPTYYNWREDVTPPMPANPYQAYRQTAVATASPAHLVLMLYRAAIRFARQAALALERGELENGHVNLLRAQAIIAELRSTLDLSAGQMAANLDALYDYFLRRLAEANVRKAAAPAVEVAGMMEQLLSAWETAVEGSRVHMEAGHESAAVAAAAASGRRPGGR